MIIDCIPQISSVDPFTTCMPVVIVLIINLIREAVEDYRKYLNDKGLNEAMISVYKFPKFLGQKTEKLKVGQIVRVKKNQVIPADLLIIKTSLKNGFCYMQTSNLDGESTLKPREAVNITQQKIKINSPKTLKNLFSPLNDNCYIEVNPPNKDIYDVAGTIFFKKQKVYIKPTNVLLRGSRLKSVDYAYGIAIYTGKDTKLMLNINRTTLKISDIDRILGYIVIFLSPSKPKSLMGILFSVCDSFNIINSFSLKVYDSEFNDSLVIISLFSFSSFNSLIFILYFCLLISLIATYFPVSLLFAL